MTEVVEVTTTTGINQEIIIKPKDTITIMTIKEAMTIEEIIITTIIEGDTIDHLIITITDLNIEIIIIIEIDKSKDIEIDQSLLHPQRVDLIVSIEREERERELQMKVEALLLKRTGKGREKTERIVVVPLRTNIIGKRRNPILAMNKVDIMKKEQWKMNIPEGQGNQAPILIKNEFINVLCI